MSTMRAVAVNPGRREVQVIDHPVPQMAEPDHVRVRIRDVGVCGTDKEICAFEYGTPPPGSEWLVIGHESLGEVVETGSGVTGLKAGDLVVPMVRRPCGIPGCFPCAGERADFCSTGRFTERGIGQIHGFMTEQIVDRERYLVWVPARLRDVAVLVEPLTIAEKALMQLGAVQSRLPWGCPHSASEGWGHCHQAVVLGAGPVGLLGAMALQVAGFDTWVYSREGEDSPRADLVRSFGGTYVSGATHDAAALAKRMGRIDVVYEAVGVPALVYDLMPHLAPNGAFCLTGVPALRPPSLVPTSNIMRAAVLGNQVIFGSVNAGRNAFEAAIKDLDAFLARWPETLKALITGRHPVDDYRDLLLGHAAGIKNVISFSGTQAR